MEARFIRAGRFDGGMWCGEIHRNLFLSAEWKVNEQWCSWVAVNSGVALGAFTPRSICFFFWNKWLVLNQFAYFSRGILRCCIAVKWTEARALAGLPITPLRHACWLIVEQHHDNNKMRNLVQWEAEMGHQHLSRLTHFPDVWQNTHKNCFVYKIMGEPIKKRGCWKVPHSKNT